MSDTQLEASASDPTTGVTVLGTFVYTPSLGTDLGRYATLNTTFTPSDTTNYTAIFASVSINVTKTIPNISWNNPADIVYGTPLTTTQLDATASVQGTCLYSAIRNFT